MKSVDMWRTREIGVTAKSTRPSPKEYRQRSAEQRLLKKNRAKRERNQTNEIERTKLKQLENDDNDENELSTNPQPPCEDS